VATFDRSAATQQIPSRRRRKVDTEGSSGKIGAGADGFGNDQLLNVEGSRVADYGGLKGDGLDSSGLYRKWVTTPTDGNSLGYEMGDDEGRWHLPRLLSMAPGT
jgi:hypothetical protein